jgi:hypothetical protein
MKRLAGMAAVAALMFFLPATVASAHTVRHDSQVTFHLKTSGPAAGSFAGKVVSQRPRCERNRRINFFRRVSDGREFVGRTTTNAEGAYEFEPTGEVAAGTYFAVATRKVLRRNANHLHVCRRAVSQDRRVPGPPGR